MILYILFLILFLWAWKRFFDAIGPDKGGS